jgi:hypothetical protein
LIERRLCLYYRKPPETDRWVRGDRLLRPIIRRVIRGRPQVSGVDKVFVNLCRGLDELGVEYTVNLPFNRLRPDDRVGVLGRERYALEGYTAQNPIVAGIALMTHPSEWPTLCDEYPVRRYLQHSAWACDVYKPYFHERCGIWPAGIDTASWRPGDEKDIDLLIYDKLRWDREILLPEFLNPIKAILARLGLATETIRYGSYAERDFRQFLRRSRGMLFLSGHESQGFACQECLSCDVPVLAWNPGRCLDPNRFVWGQPEIAATSVPYFDARCGERFTSMGDFEERLSTFLEKVRSGAYRPREYVVENLTLRKSASRFLDFFEEV